MGGKMKETSSCKHIRKNVLRDHRPWIMSLVKILIFIVFLGFYAFANAEAAPRNLLTEFEKALEEIDVHKVQSLLKEGVYVTDSVDPTINLAQEVSRLIRRNDPEYKETISKIMENNCISIIKIIAKAGGNFSAALEQGYFTTPIFKTFLDCGAKVNSYISSFYYYSKDDREELEEKIKLLVQSGTKVSDADFLSFLRSFLGRNELNKVSVEKNIAIIALLKKAGASANSHTQSLFDEFRREYRNEPELLAYCNEIEESLAGTSLLGLLWSWKWKILIGFLVLGTIGGIAETGKA